MVLSSEILEQITKKNLSEIAIQPLMKNDHDNNGRRPLWKKNGETPIFFYFYNYNLSMKTIIISSSYNL